MIEPEGVIAMIGAMRRFLKLALFVTLVGAALPLMAQYGSRFDVASIKPAAAARAACSFASCRGADPTPRT